MTRFNTIKHFISLMLLAISSILLYGCKGKDIPTVMPPVNVDVKIVEGDNSYGSTRTFSGTVESAEATTVSFSVPGTIIRIYTEVGQKVDKGQLLARLKAESLVNANNIAQAELEEAQDAYRRLKKLHDANALPDIKWVEVQSKLKQAENAAALANRAVGDASIYSPMSGYVSEKFSDDGQTVIAAQPILRIVNLNDMRIAISVPEEEISQFNDGSVATVTFDGLDSLKVDGKISQKAVVADPLTRSYTVKFSIQNPAGKILPGMIGTVSVGAAGDAAVESSSLILPSKSVLLDADNRQFVWTVKDGKAIRKYVRADEFSPDGVVVKSGLVKGDSVIVAGMQKVGSGTKVAANIIKGV